MENNDKNHKSLKERLDYLEEKNGNGKKKKFFIPFKARLGKKQIKDGYVSILKIEDNHNIDFVKEPIRDGVINMGDTFHAIDPEDIFFYKNKPFIFQAKRSQNPYNPLSEAHETYGHKYILARMEGDKILGKKKAIGWGITIVGIVIAGIIAYSFITGA